MAILFNGIVMSHYSHFNLSTVTQITMQQTLRTLAFICETCVFAYLGLAIFSFKHSVEPALVIWSVVLCLVGRAANIFPLCFLVNKFRTTKITPKMSFIMWFSGLRGAISYALSLHLEYSKEETRRVVITTTLIIVLFTTVIFGGSTLPLLKFLQAGKKCRRAADGRTRSRSSRVRRKEKVISLSKTREFGQAIDSEHLSELTEEDEINFANSKLGGFAKLDRKYFTPFFTRRFTNQVTVMSLQLSIFIYLLLIHRNFVIANHKLRNCKVSGMRQFESITKVKMMKTIYQKPRRKRQKELIPRYLCRVVPF